ncbi:hypothetical protein FRC08_014623 [Ceratobasidium sp. 394]|nr:hypothetical protein FRC08_014623 [Ceratobasidium sp. 394]
MFILNNKVLCLSLAENESRDAIILATGKNIVVLCDGTGEDGLMTTVSIKGAAKVMLQKRQRSRPIPTNVLRLSRCITQYTEEEPSWFTIRLRGTAIGSKIRDAYNLIAQNWAPGDRI